MPGHARLHPRVHFVAATFICTISATITLSSPSEAAEDERPQAQAAESLPMLPDDPTLPTGVVPRVVTLNVGDVALLHATWADASHPDAPDLHVVFRTRDGELPVEVTRWESTVPSRVFVADVDEDGEPELVRDHDGPQPCSETLWWSPEVLDLTSGEFSPAQVGRGSVAATPLAHEPALPGPPGAYYVGASSGGALDAGDPLADADRDTGWTSSTTNGWIALVGPENDAPEALEIAVGAEADPAVVRVDLGGAWGELTLEPGYYRVDLGPLASPPRGCVVVRVEMPHAVRVRELRVVGDSSVPTNDVWIDAIEGACERGDANGAAQLAGRALVSGDEATRRLIASTSPCVASALASAAASEGPEALATLAQSDEASAVAVAALVSAWSNRASVAAIAAQALIAADRSEQHAEPWARAAVQRLDAGAPWSAPDGSGEEIFDTLVSGAVGAPVLRVVADAAVSRGLTLPWRLSTLPADRDAAIWVLGLAAETEPGALELAPGVVSEALAHDDAGVARLGAHNAGRHGVREATSRLLELAGDDPSPHIRATAVRALDALGELAPIAMTIASDESATVRLELARSATAGEMVEQEGAASIRRLTTEAWPEVRQAWIRTLVERDLPAIDDALAGHLGAEAETGAEDGMVVLRAWARRDSAVPLSVARYAISNGTGEAALPDTIRIVELSTERCALAAELEQAIGDVASEPPVRDALDSLREGCDGR